MPRLQMVHRCATYTQLACVSGWAQRAQRKKCPPSQGTCFSRRGCCATQDARRSVVKIAAGAAFNLDISEDPADKERTSGCVSCRQMSGGCLRGTAEIVAASRPPQRADVVGRRENDSCSCPGSIGTCLQVAPDLSGGSCALRGRTVRRREDGNSKKRDETLSFRLFLFALYFFHYLPYFFENSTETTNDCIKFIY